MLIDKLLYQRRIKRELGLDEDYTSGPWTPPNDTSYVGFFFEKDVNSFPARVRKEYEEIKQAILQREEELREKYGDDWRNVAVFQAYRLMKEAAEALADEKEERLVEKELTDAEKKKREEIAQAIERDNPDMPMGKKMAIATAMAKKVAEEETKFDPKKFSEWKTVKE